MDDKEIIRNALEHEVSSAEYAIETAMRSHGDKGGDARASALRMVERIDQAVAYYDAVKAALARHQEAAHAD